MTVFSHLGAKKGKGGDGGEGGGWKEGGLTARRVGRGRKIGRARGGETFLTSSKVPPFSSRSSLPLSLLPQQQQQRLFLLSAWDDVAVGPSDEKRLQEGHLQIKVWILRLFSERKDIIREKQCREANLNAIQGVLNLG